MRTGIRRHYTSTLNLPWVASIGAALGACIGIQLGTGIVLSTRISPIGSYESIVNTSRDLDVGLLVRALHTSGATAVMLLLYIHLAKAVWMQRTSSHRGVWLTGLGLYLGCIGACFTGYSLTGGQMSHWAITVICSLVSAVPFVGQDILETLWGGTVVSIVSVQRMYTAHMFLPIVVGGLAVGHILLLHRSNSVGPIPSHVSDRVPFHALYAARDVLMIVATLLVCGWVSCFAPGMVIDAENSVPSDASVTPASIAPEWYLLPYYGLVRAVPSKILGVVAMGLSYGCLASAGDAGLRSSLCTPLTLTVARVALLLLALDMSVVSITCMQVNSNESAYALLVAACASWMCGTLAVSARTSSPVATSNQTPSTHSLRSYPTCGLRINTTLPPSLYPAYRVGPWRVLYARAPRCVLCSGIDL